MPRERQKFDKKRKGGDRNRDTAQSGKSRVDRSDSRNGVWLFGLHPVRAALQNPQRSIIALRASRNAAAELADLAAARNIAVQDTHPADIADLLPPGAVHQGVALLTAPLSPPALEHAAAQASENATIVVLDQVTDPHNVGAILRSAAVFGVAFVVVPDRHAPPDSGTLAKSASGALESLPLVRVGNLAQAMKTIQKAGFWVVGLDGSTDDTLDSIPQSGKLALVLGSEGKGLRRLTVENCDQVVRIAMAENAVGSLNVSNAGAIALHHVTKQRHTV